MTVTVTGHWLLKGLEAVGLVRDIQLPDGLLDAPSLTCPRALLLPQGDRDCCKEQDGYNECSSHGEFSSTCLESPEGSKA